MTREKAHPRDGELAENRQSSEDSAAIARAPVARQSGDDAAQPPGPLSIEAFQARTSAHLHNILDNSGIPLLLVDRDLRLCLFTPAVTALFEITAANLGQSLVELPRCFADDDLALDAEAVIATNGSLRRVVDTAGGASFERRLSPYRADDNTAQGVVITFADISDQRRAERESDAIVAYANGVIDTVRQSLVVLDEELRVISANPTFYRTFLIVPAEAVGKSLPSLRDRCFDVPAVRNFLASIAAGADVAEDCAIEIELPRHGRHVLFFNARNIAAPFAGMPRTLLAIDGRTDAKDDEPARVAFHA